MRIGIIGLGSMGKRRVRNLNALNISDVIGFDSREDRRAESANRYKIPVTDRLSDLENVDAVIISTPPDRHEEFIGWSVARRKPAFVELSISLQNLPRLHEEALANGVLLAPSGTLIFHPAIIRLRGLVQSRRFGAVTDFIYHSGNYLPDWHPWEKVQNFFVSNPTTSGCRELLAYELNWISHCFGRPAQLRAVGKKTLDLGLQSNDVCALQILHRTFVASLMVDVVSRFATRNLTVNFEKAQFRWSWEHNETRLYVADEKRWLAESYELGEAETGYNENISESIYVDEMSAFLDAVKGKKPFPRTLEDDIYNLTLLDQKDMISVLGG